jgi:hypothetical protein
MAAASLFVADGVRHLVGCLDNGTFSPRFWTAEFWAAIPGIGLGPNPRWLIRIFGGLAGFLFGLAVFKFATR